jgi:hypothetical protein
MINIFISYIPSRRIFTARRAGVPRIGSAPSLPELRTALTQACPQNVKLAFSLSRAARAEVARRRNGGVPVNLGWT